MPVAVLKNGTVYYVYADQLNAPRVIVNAADTLVWDWEGAPFGNTLPNQDPASTGIAFVYNLRFPGQYYDAESGLHYNMARDYNPSTGRYIESDPVGLQAQINTYAYVEGSPVSRTDSQGQDDSPSLTQQIQYLQDFIQRYNIIALSELEGQLQTKAVQAYENDNFPLGNQYEQCAGQLHELESQGYGNLLNWVRAFDGSQPALLEAADNAEQIYKLYEIAKEVIGE
jgi:RHS repeat-associated protein